MFCYAKKKVFRYEAQNVAFARKYDGMNREKKFSFLILRLIKREDNVERGGLWIGMEILL